MSYLSAVNGGTGEQYEIIEIEINQNSFTEIFVKSCVPICGSKLVIVLLGLG